MYISSETLHVYFRQKQGLKNCAGSCELSIVRRWLHLYFTRRAGTLALLRPVHQQLALCFHFRCPHRAPLLAVAAVLTWPAMRARQEEGRLLFFTVFGRPAGQRGMKSEGRRQQPRGFGRLPCPVPRGLSSSAGDEGSAREEDASQPRSSRLPYA